MYQLQVGDKPEEWGLSRVFTSKDATEAGLFQCEPGQSLPLHTHAEGDEYIYLFQGEGNFVVGDEEFVVKPGGLVKAPKGVLHRCYNTAEKPFSCFYVVRP